MSEERFFPVEPWHVRETHLDPDQLARAESTFALSNGHIGLRGNLDEGEPRGLNGTYLNAFYESYPLAYGERGFGFAEDGQAIVNVTDGKVIHLLVEDEPVDVLRGEVLDHERVLDLRAGMLQRRMHWRSAYGHEVRLRTERLVSFTQRSIAGISYEIEAVDRPVRVVLQSNLIANQQAAEPSGDPRRARDLGNVLVPRLSVAHDTRVVLAHSTRASGLSEAAGMDHVLDERQDMRHHTYAEDDLGRVTISVRLEPGHPPLRLIKFLAYHWSSRQTTDWLRDQVDASLEGALAEGWDGLVAAQRRFLDDFWSRADVELDGDGEVQQALRFALFHVLQAGARAEGRAIPAKGLTGPGYDGHAFWDTEAFVLPVMTYVQPDVVRDALRWRHSTLPLALERAAQLGAKGALFPWRTIHGEECSGYWPAGTAAVHVDADVAEAVRRYIDATGDEEFAALEGGELLVETARFWQSTGSYDHEGMFRIDGVTGPDEYSALVDNNVYTNLMAQANLRAAAEVVDRHEELSERLGVDADEPERWRASADAVHIPYDQRLRVHPQDQDFLTHAVWDFEHTPPETYPLLLHYPYFQLYRKQVIKQADLVLALHLRGDAFTDEEKRRDFEYYEALTVRDSSLSACSQAIVAAEVGHLELAYDYLREAALVDLHDLHRNSADGLHIASLAGAVLAVTNGLGGMRDTNGGLIFRPRLPAGLERLAFSIGLRDGRLRVEVLPHEARYELLSGTEVELRHFDEAVHVRHGQHETRPIPPLHRLPRPRQPAGRAPARRPRPRRMEG
ncbi:MAG: alpha,alpha-trehalose phosphorylase [Solirubrobacteraceae bacterium]|nr:alpha,alpha-trehalose phosphorylase [Solirubrobacteraceae bacterium]